MSLQWSEVNWSSLEDKGYLFLPSALPGPYVQKLLAEYHSHARAVTGQYNHNITHLRPAILKKYEQAFRRNLIPQIAAHTGIRVNYVEDGIFFAIERGINNPWHLDDTTAYFVNDKYNYLNIYLYLQKPDPSKSNLRLVPLDVMKRESPAMANLFFGRGAARAYVKNGRTLFVDDIYGESHVEKVDLDALAVTPEAQAGDMLILRGDTFHKTQDTDTDRIAISFRLLSTESRIRKGQFEKNCVRQALVMARNVEFNFWERYSQRMSKDDVPYVRFRRGLERFRKAQPEKSHFDIEVLELENVAQALANKKTQSAIFLDQPRSSAEIKRAFEALKQMQGGLLLICQPPAEPFNFRSEYPTLEYLVVRDKAFALQKLKDKGLTIVGVDTEVRAVQNSKLQGAIFVFSGASGHPEVLPAICDFVIPSVA